MKKVIFENDDMIIHTSTMGGVEITNKFTNSVMRVESDTMGNKVENLEPEKNELIPYSYNMFMQKPK